MLNYNINELMAYSKIMGLMINKLLLETVHLDKRVLVRSIEWMYESGELSKEGMYFVVDNRMSVIIPPRSTIDAKEPRNYEFFPESGFVHLECAKVFAESITEIAVSILKFEFLNISSKRQHDYSLEMQYAINEAYLTLTNFDEIKSEDCIVDHQDNETFNSKDDDSEKLIKSKELKTKMEKIGLKLLS